MLRDVDLSRTSGLSSLQPDLTLSATQLLAPSQSPKSVSRSGSLALAVSEQPETSNDPSRRSPSLSNAIVRSKLGSILPEQITTNFLTKTDTKAEELDPVDIEKGAFLIFTLIVSKLQAAQYSVPSMIPVAHLYYT